jgi:hypothetical protein
MPWQPATTASIVIALNPRNSQWSRCIRASMTSGRRLRIATPPASRQGLDDKKDQDEDQPQQQHGIHPSELNGAKAVPKIEPMRHVKAARGY